MLPEDLQSACCTSSYDVWNIWLQSSRATLPKLYLSTFTYLEVGYLEVKVPT